MATRATFDADFGQFVSELNKVEVKLRAFEGSAEKSSTKLQRLSDSLNGNKLVEQAAVAVAAINKIEGGVAGLNNGELRRYGTLIDEATDKLKRMGREVPPEIAKVKASLDTARVGIDGNAKSAGVMQGALTKLGPVVASAFAVDRIVAFGQELLNAGGHITDLSAKTGIGVVGVQRLQFVMEQAGGSIDQASNAIGQMQDRLVSGDKSAVSAIRALGLSVEDVLRQEPDKAFLQIGERLGGIEDPAVRVNLAMDIFGKTGKEVLPAMSTDIRDVADAASVMSADTVRTLDEAGDAWDEMAARVKNVVANTLVGAYRELQTLEEAARTSTPGEFFEVFRKAQENRELYGTERPTFRTSDITLGETLRRRTAVEEAADREELARQKRREAAAAEHQRRLDALTGRDVIARARQTIADIQDTSVGVMRLTPAQASRVFGDLVDAREVAKLNAPRLVSGFTLMLTDLARNPQIATDVRKAGEKIFTKLVDPKELRKLLQQGAAQAIKDVEFPLLPTFALPKIGVGADPFDSIGISGASTWNQLMDGTNRKLAEATKTSRDWKGQLQNVAQAFTNLAQISGGALDGFTRSIGVIFSAADAGQQLVKSLGDLLGDDKFAESAAGRGLAGGLAGFATGSQLGALIGNGGFGTFLAGAAGGAASGGLAGGWAGAGVGLVLGGIGAIVEGEREERERRELMRQNRTQLLAQFESREDLIAQAQRVGISEREINRFILENTNDTEGYARSVTALNAAFNREERQAEALARSLGEVARVNGVLSRSQVQDLRGALFNDGQLLPVDGATRPRNPNASLPESALEGEGPRGGPRAEAAEAFLTQQSQSLLAGLRTILDTPGALSADLVASVGESLPALSAELQRQGMSTIDILHTMEPLLTAFNEKAVLAGMGSTPGFDALNAQLALLKDERLGPLIERATGAGQSLGAMNNLGLLTQETFAGFASAITATTEGLDLLSADGQNAMRLIRQPLQNVWQLQQDFGYEVDESTQALLDQAEAAGLIGDKFRPTEEKMLTGIETIVERLDQMIAIFTGDLVDDSRAGAATAGQGILDEFAKVRPRIRVEFEYEDPPGGGGTPTDPAPVPTPPPAPAPAGQRHPGSTDRAVATIRSATTTSRTGLYIDGREAGYALLPHLGGLLEFHGA